MLRVLKYGTGHEIPEGATYLSTQVEKVIEVKGESDYYECRPREYKEKHTETNALVWHYFLVECDKDGNPPPTRERP